MRSLILRHYTTVARSALLNRSTVERDDIIREKYADGLSIPKLA